MYGAALRVPQVRRDQAALCRRARPEPRHGVGAPRERRQLGEGLSLHRDHRGEAHVVQAHLPDGVRAVRGDVGCEEGAIVPGRAGGAWRGGVRGGSHAARPRGGGVAQRGGAGVRPQHMGELSSPLSKRAPCIVPAAESR